MGTTINARMQQRSDTAENWSLINPVLRVGELGHEQDTGEYKAGDGVTAWLDLPYVLGGLSDAVQAAWDARDEAEGFAAAVEAVVATTDGLMTAVDLDDASDFRVQQDARIAADTRPPAVVNPITGWIHADHITGTDEYRFHAAAEAAMSLGRPMYAPGSFRLTTQVVVDRPLKIIGGGSPGSGGYGTVYRDADFGDLFRIEHNLTMSDMFLYDDSTIATRAGSALGFYPVWDGTTGALVRAPGFCRFDNVRVSGATAAGTSPWERTINMQGEGGWLQGSNAVYPGPGLPPIRDVFFVGCHLFGARSTDSTIRLNRVAHVQFIGGFHDAAPSSSVQKIFVSDDSSDVQFAGFEAIANLETGGDKVGWSGGNLGANSGNALKLRAAATRSMIAADIVGAIVDESTSATNKIVTTRSNIPVVHSWNGTPGTSPLKWGHSNALYRSSLGALSSQGYNYVGLHAEQSATTNLLRNDGTTLRGFAIGHTFGAAGSVSMSFADTAVAGATWSSLTACEAMRLRYSATTPGADIGRTPTGNHLNLSGHVTTGSPSIYAAGADATVSLDLGGKGGGIVSLNVLGGTSGFRSGNGVGGVTFKVNGSGYIDTLSGTAVSIRAGAGSPEGVVAAVVGSTYHRTDGGAATSHYVKETGTGNTGWVGK